MLPADGGGTPPAPMHPSLPVFLILTVALGLFVWGRLRYDVVALLALLAAVVAGAVPASEAFLGFGHPAVITVAAMLVISHGLSNAGVVDVLARWLARAGERPTAQVAVQSSSVAAFSGFMNNVGALALLMPVSIRIARRMGRSPSAFLMPLAFGSLLGGFVTLIGTPPNIIVATFREGGQFGMFDFAPVGIPLMFLGLAFLAVGWRLLPDRAAGGEEEALFEEEGYVIEAVVPDDAEARAIELVVAESGADVQVVGRIREGQRRMFPSPYDLVRSGDHLLVEGESEELERFVEGAGLRLEAHDGTQVLADDEVAVVEAVVLPESPLVGQTAAGLRLRQRFGANVLAVAQDRRVTRRLGEVRFAAGDLLLLQTPSEGLRETLERLGVLPVHSDEDAPRFRPKRGLWLSLVAFAAGIAATSLGLLPVEIAFAGVAVFFVLVGLVPLEGAYRPIDWPVIVLLAALIPVGAALEATGGTDLIVDALVGVAGGLPAWAALGVLLVVTFVLTNVINNAAAAVLMAPIALHLADGLGASPDAYLMGVAVAAGGAFLTPVGHQSATLVFGPGGYRFGDYARLGLPLTLLILVASVPLLLFVWG